MDGERTYTNPQPESTGKEKITIGILLFLLFHVIPVHIVTSFIYAPKMFSITWSHYKKPYHWMGIFHTTTSNHVESEGAF